MRAGAASAACLALALLAACGGEPDGGLVEVHATLDPSIEPGLRDYRVYRVIILGATDDAIREIELRGAGPDVFVVRSPITIATEDSSIYVRVQALLFTIDAGEIIEGCAEEGDVQIVEGAVQVLELTLMPGDCP